ncbi:phenazine biosynthesis PhzF protein [Dendryphion nanum]|uniref:Phenazine biosynthesis PhzF protein n=1 Tax=Dendryphion nanum TaxID=256645 RepID=A0A9P9DGG2_9PLEO|nr:phenazine biosynthesis PhzF protein [Dendryphion nanum]
MSDVDADPIELDFVTLDVFTQNKYEGNPLAIVNVPASVKLTQAQKQSIAREFNLSETTFLHEQSSEKLSWTVDIFMTNAELPFAGHPTIGTACYALAHAAVARNLAERTLEAEFKIKAGPVGLQYDVRNKTARASIPHDFHVHTKRWTRGELLKLYPKLKAGFENQEFGLKEDFPIVSVVKGMTFVLAELESEKALSLVGTTGSSLFVDGLDQAWCETFVGLYFFVRGGEAADGTKKLRTRMIEGTLEDPATGSAASDLAGYLALVEGKSGETLKFAITQGVEMGRRSEIGLEIVRAGGDGIDKVYLEGSAVKVMEGRLSV